LATIDGSDVRRHRVVFALIIVLSASGLGYGYATSAADDTVSAYERQAQIPSEERTAVVPPRENVTVVAGHGMKGESAALVAFGPDGEVLYHDDRHHGYFDVDPSDRGRMTVEYVAEHPYEGSDCDGKCTVSVVERVNLTTGEVTELYSEVLPQDRGANWHDADRVGEDRLLVADIYRDEVYVVNTTTGVTTWEWSAKTDFPIDEAGPYPADWSHINDVEELPDGRYMVSLRNQDQVVFLDPETGLQENWTLGAEDDYRILYEQHNPDYVPGSEGGPAVIVADSLNDRVIEFQREDEAGGTGGEWTKSWVWADEEMKWPRDADRLPNGNTLVADTNAHRVVEVDEQGEVVWRIDFYAPYDVERLGTGDESAGGPAAEEADLQSHTAEGDGDVDETTSVAGFTPRKVLNSVAFVLPLWMGFGDAVLVAVIVLTALAWAVIEYRSSSYSPSLSLQWPIRRE
jgi:hypothetical protein